MQKATKVTQVHRDLKVNQASDVLMVCVQELRATKEKQVRKVKPVQQVRKVPQVHQDRKD